MYFHTDSASAKDLINALTDRALDTDARLRIDVDREGSLRIKIGEGMWSAPFASTPDPYRDNS